MYSKVLYDIKNTNKCYAVSFSNPCIDEITFNRQKNRSYYFSLINGQFYDYVHK